MLDATQLDTITQKSRQCFLEEDAPQYQNQLQEGLTQLEDEANWEKAIEDLKKTVHAIKGGAGLAQLNELSELNKYLEEILEAIFRGRVAETDIAYELVWEGVKESNNLISGYLKGETPPTETAVELGTAISEFLETLPAAEETEATEEEGVPFFMIQNALEVDLEECITRVEPFLEQSSSELIPALETFCDECTMFAQALNLQWLQDDLKPLKSAVAQKQSDVSAIAKETITTLREHRQEYLSGETSPVVASDHRENFGLDLEKILTGFDQITQTCRELMIYYDQLRGNLQQMARSRNTPETEQAQTQLKNSLENVQNLIDTLKTNINDSRFVSLANYAEKFAIPFHNSLNQLYNQQVKLVLEGEDTLVDQVILEQLKTPLKQLFQNAFEFSIEPKEERVAVDKSPTATLTLKAQQRENRLIIEISDDGRGIDLEHIFAQAKTQGLTQAEHPKQLTRNQILNFVFLPKFSQAQSIYGFDEMKLDEVSQAVKDLNGSISFDSKLGKGTRVIFSIPLHLSILPLLLCRAQAQTLAFPKDDIVSVVNLEEMSEEKTISWQEKTLPVYSLLQLLPYNQGIPPSGSETTGLVLKVGERYLVVAVDSLKGEQELAIKPFDSTISVPPYVIGCSILETGEVVPVLTPDDFGELLALMESPSRPKKESDSSSSDSTVMVVDDSMTVRMTLEEILNDAGYQVITCRDGNEACKVLEETSEDIGVVMCDIEMPRLNGFGVLEAIRSHRRWHSLPVVMLSSPGKNNNEQKVYSLGANEFMSKQFQPDELLKVIQNYYLE